MVTPTIRRQVVGHVIEAHELSERRACRALGVSRTGYRYRSRRKEPKQLVQQLRELAAERPRSGYRGLYRLLRRRGQRVNHKRVYRLYRLEGLHVRTKRRKRFAASPRVEIPKATRPGQVWSMDFVSDHLVNGRRFRILTVVDRFSRRCPGVLVDTSIPGRRVAWFLDELAAECGYYPETITVDNGPEFISNVLDQWATERQSSYRRSPSDRNSSTECRRGRSARGGVAGWWSRATDRSDRRRRRLAAADAQLSRERRYELWSAE